MARTKQTARTAGPIPTHVILKDGATNAPKPAKKRKIASAHVLKTFRCGVPFSWKYPQIQSHFNMILFGGQDLQDEICLYEDNCEKLKLHQTFTTKYPDSTSVPTEILEDFSDALEKQNHGKLWWSNLCSKTNSTLEIRHGDTLTLHDITNYHKFMAYWTERHVDGAIFTDYLMLPVQKDYSHGVPSGDGVSSDFCDAPEEWFDDNENFFVHPNYIIPGTYTYDLLNHQSVAKPAMDGHIAWFALNYENLERELEWIREEPASNDEHLYAPVLEVPLVEFYQRRKEREKIWKQINFQVLKITIRPLELPDDIIRHIANFLY